MIWEFDKNFKIWCSVADAWELWYWRYEIKNFISSCLWGRPTLTDRKYCCVEPAVFKTILAWSGAEFSLFYSFAPKRLLNLLTTHTKVQTVSLVPSISLPCFAAIPLMLWIFTQSWRDMPPFRNGRVDDNWLYKARHLECFILATSSSMLSAGWHWLHKMSASVASFNSLCWCLCASRV